ncbi:MAG: hypothetical protein U0610_06610 [bacterium]
MAVHEVRAVTPAHHEVVLDLVAARVPHDHVAGIRQPVVLDHRVVGFPEPDAVAAQPERELRIADHVVAAHHDPVGSLDEDAERGVADDEPLDRHVVAGHAHRRIDGVEAASAAVDGEAQQPHADARDADRRADLGGDDHGLGRPPDREAAAHVQITGIVSRWQTERGTVGKRVEDGLQGATGVASAQLAGRAGSARRQRVADAFGLAPRCTGS